MLKKHVEYIKQQAKIMYESDLSEKTIENILNVVYLKGENEEIGRQIQRINDENNHKQSIIQ